MQKTFDVVKEIEKIKEIEKQKGNEQVLLFNFSDDKGEEYSATISINDFVHAIVPGQTGSGKSTTLINFALLHSLLNKEKGTTWFFADGKRGGDYDAVKNLSPLPVAHNFSEFETLINTVWAEYEYRQKLFQEAREEGKKVRNLHEYRQEVGPLPRVWVVVDELKALIRDVDWDSLAKTNGTAINRLERLLSESRSFGFTFIFSSQRVYQDSYPTSIRRNLPTMLAHKLQSSDQQMLGLKMPDDMDKGEYIVRADGLDPSRGHFPVISLRANDTVKFVEQHELKFTPLYTPKLSLWARIKSFIKTLF
ncbi:MAG: hypothetical protein KF802_02325 [Bdellovibrionaceae bacterium]|nr:hypothetical protein [Pseudobdellovibrionaceae bacterium]